MSSRPLACGLAIAAGVLGAAAPSPNASAQAEGASYRLVETWGGVPWEPRAGHFGLVADVGTSADGSVFVLDSRHGVIHVLGWDGVPRARFPAIDAGPIWAAERLDVADDGTIVVLSEAIRGVGKLRTRVDRVTPDGRPMDSFELETDYDDVAVHPEGRIFLVRLAPLGQEKTFGGLDVYDAHGAFVAGIGQEWLVYPVGVDVAADGTIYVLNRLPTAGWGEVPGPPPTPLPSRAVPRVPQQFGQPVEGVVIFASERALAPKEVVPFNGPEDIAAGRSGVFVSRNVEVFRVGAREPLYSGPAGQVYASYLGGSVMHVAAPQWGGLLLGLAHCYFQGVLALAEPLSAPEAPQLWGKLDRPELEGPVYPLRVAADEGLAVLQGRFTNSGARPDPRYGVGPYAGEPQTVQRWTRSGELRSQLGLCGGFRAGRDEAETWWTRDVALAGDEVFTTDGSLVQGRPDDGFPAWTVWPGALAGGPSRLVGIDARDGRVAVLDIGDRAAVILDRLGETLGRIPLDELGPAPVPTAIALAGDRLYVADRGRGRVSSWRLDGSDPRAWGVHDGPLALAGGPTGDVFVLGAGGWGLRYRPDGALVASWRMPDPAARPLDIAVARDGRVAVSFVVPVEAPVPAPSGAAFEIESAGVWHFASSPVPPGASIPPDGCLARPDKRASPAVVRLGEEVEVTLEVAGRCPGRVQRAQVVLVVDTSRSMNWLDALGRGQEAALALLAALDPRAAEVGLVTFDEGAALRAALTDDLGAVAAQVSGLAAIGDTRVAAGLEQARLMLGAARTPGTRQAIVLVTDGDFKDDPTAAQEAADRARADDIDLFALVFPTEVFGDLHPPALRRLTGAPERVLIDPDTRRIDEAVRDLTGTREEDGLFAGAEIRDVVPANMDFVEGSAWPPATLAGDALTWRLGAVPARSGVTLRYRLRPLEVGTWPTNVTASAAYTDALGMPGTLVFPIPRVKVWDRSTLTQRAYLPYGAAGACLRPDVMLDVVLALDTSESMAEPATSGGTKLDAARAAARQFLGFLQPGADRAAVVSFHREARRAVGLTADFAAWDAALAGLTTSPGTRIDLGLAEAERALADGERPDARGAVVLLTDGLQTGDSSPVLSAADAIKLLGARLFTIGLGTEIDRALLRSVATDPRHAYESPTTDELAAIYGRISEALACGVR